jgi:putative ABC transport system permease protein
MFFTYLGRELRRRSRQAIVIALGIGIGVGLVIVVGATSAGVTAAQSSVLHSLYGVGTDITVTQSATPGSGGPQSFQFGGGGGAGANGTTPTTLAPGTPINRSTLRPAPGQGTLTGEDVTTVSKLRGVAAASGGLSLTELDVSGTVPASGGTGGGFGSNFSVNNFSVSGVDVATNAVGPIGPSSVTSGRYFTSSENSAAVAVLSSSFAKQQTLSVGSTVTVGGKPLQVIGIASVTTTSASDIYLPLGEAQSLASLQDQVSTIYVSATSSSAVQSVAQEIATALPKATVTTSASLASEVTGSLSSASSLANNLGTWLAIIALIVAFLVAGLLMMAAVGRRVRELGTLKAIGWRTRRVVGQVMGEGVVQGLAGGVIGLVIGIVGAQLVTLFAPSLTATVGPTSATGGGFAGTGGGRFGGGTFAGGGGGSGRPGFAGRFSDLTHTTVVHLSAPLQGGTLALAIGLAIAGGLIAGAFGSWRAARLQPAAALRRAE